jgi:hypothetical protein
MADEDKQNPAEAYQKLLDRHDNNAGQLALKLFGENYDLRESNRQLKQQVPADGNVVLSAEDAKKWKAFQDLGKEVKDIKSALEKLPALETENQKLSKRDNLRAVAALGYDFDVLEEQLGKFPNHELATKKIKNDKGEEVSAPYITIDGKESSLDDFAKENFAKYLPVLKVNTETQPAPKGNGYDPKPSGNAGGFFDRIRESVKEKADAAPKVDINARFGKQVIS